MTTEYIREFLILSEVLNFSTAADRLSMTQATLSRHIQALEKDLNCTLFVRHARGVTLSEEGMLFLPYAQSLNNIYSQGLSTLFLRARELSGTLNIAATNIVISHYSNVYIDFLRRFAQKYPGVQININEDTGARIREQLQNGECDFAFVHRTHNVTENEFSVVECYRDSIAVVFPETHPLAKERLVSFSQLQNETFILQPANSPIRNQCIQACRRAGYEPQSIFNVSAEGPGMIELVRRGCGITFQMKRQVSSQQIPGTAIIDMNPPEYIYIDFLYRKTAMSALGDSFCKHMQYIQKNYTPNRLVGKD